MEMERQEYVYDAQGQLIEEKNFLETGEIADHMTYKRNGNGQIIEAYKHYLDGSVDTVKYKRDAEGNLIEKRVVDSENETEALEVMNYQGKMMVAHKQFEYDELISEVSFVYDDHGNIIQQEKWNNDEEKRSIENSFDDKGNLIKSLQYNEDDQLIARNIYTYTDDGKPLRIEEETVAGKNITLLEYDEKGNTVKQTETDGEGGIKSQVSRQYNEDNLVTEAEVFIDFQGRAVNQEYILRYSYEFYEQD